ncbi:MAG TPA: hypothetical protein VF631_05580 [Allosphingosinicella sp.]|jgi:hypothetical protein|uniref:hypothetical protein n=1 Tax=Allosphingosinicella sp. TaxID=2823234 RepID=UPI002F2AD852
MAENTKTPPAKTRGSALDVPMAALAGGSVGFFAFAMPANLFERLVGATGLPSLVPAAQPPLGETARLGFVAVAALAAFGLVWLLLRALGKAPAARKPLAEEFSNEPPRLRRADAHPDAPARHPLRAATDFGIPLDSVPSDERGEPIDVSVVENVDFEAEWERPAPSFLQAPSEVVEAEEEELLLDEAEESEPETAEAHESVIEAESTDVPFWLPEGVAAQAEEYPESEQIEDIDASPAPDAHAILPFWAQQAEAERVEDVANSPEPSLDQLSTRLEGGLIRRKRDGRSARPRGNRGADDRLRTALDDLTRMSKRS